MHVTRLINNNKLISGAYKSETREDDIITPAVRHHNSDIFGISREAVILYFMSNFSELKMSINRTVPDLYSRFARGDIEASESTPLLSNVSRKNRTSHN